MIQLMNLLGNLFGLTTELALDTVERFVAFFKRIAIRFVIFLSGLIMLGLLGAFAKIPALVSLALLGTALLILAEICLAMPVLVAATWLYENIRHVAKWINIGFALALTLIMLALFALKPGILERPLMFSLLVAWMILLTFGSIFYGSGVNPIWLIARGKIVALILVIGLLMPSGFGYAFNRISSISGIRMVNFANQFTRPNRRPYNGGTLECFDPVQPAVPTCYVGSDGLSLYDGPGADPETGEPLQAVTRDIVTAIKTDWARKEAAKPKPQPPPPLPIPTPSVGDRGSSIPQSEIGTVSVTTPSPTPTETPSPAKLFPSQPETTPRPTRSIDPDEEEDQARRERRKQRGGWYKGLRRPQ